MTSRQGMNLGQARVIDPILTTQVRGYTNAQFIFEALFPYADIPARGVRVIRFGQDAFRRENTRRAPGGPTPVITFGYESDPVALHSDALDATVPREFQEEAEAVPGIDLGAQAVQLVLDKMDLGHEIDCAAMAFDPNNYAASSKVALAGTDQWDSAASDPLQQIKDAKSAVALKIGRQPNTLTISLKILNALTANAKIKDQFKYTSGDSITAEMIARYLQIERIVVGEAVQIPDGAADGAGQFIWGSANSALLAYVNSRPQANAAAKRTSSHLEPSFGYSYRLRGYPLVEVPWFDRSRKSWLYGVSQERAPVIAMPDAGYLLTNVLANP